MIFILTVVIICVRYISEVYNVFNSKDAEERPWAYDHTAAMGAGFGFIFVLFKSVVYGAIAEAAFWILVMNSIALLP